MNLEPEEAAYDVYYRQVELQWSLARGCQIIVSPIEFEAIENWYEAGVPLPVVLRAIDLFVEKKKKAKRKRSFLLKDAHGTVEKCYREYVTIHQGEGDDHDLLTTKMKGLLKKVRALASTYPEQSEYVASLLQQLNAVDPKKVIAYERLDETLGELETAMIQHFRNRLDEAARSEIVEEIESVFREEEDPELFRKVYDDAIRTHFGLPRLTLLG